MANLQEWRALRRLTILEVEKDLAEGMTGFALLTLQAALEKLPDDPDLSYLLGYIRYQRGEFRQALHEFIQLLRRDQQAVSTLQGVIRGPGIERVRPDE